MTSILIDPKQVSLHGSSSPWQAVSLVIPAFNEELIIRQAVREASAALNEIGVRHEIIVVDDGSTDGTADDAASEAALHQNVRVVSLPQNQGYTAALRYGFSLAKYELVAFTDADCQFDLRDLGGLLRLTSDSDIVCGYRIRRKDVWRRRFLSGGFNLLARALLGTGVRDCDCALKIIPRDWINSQDFSSGGFFFNAELLAMARIDGLKVAEAGVSHRPRGAGTSKVSLRLVLPVFACLLRFWWCRVLCPGTTEQVSPARSTSDYGAILFGSVALIAVCSIVLFPWMSFPLISPDEARYSEIAREMLDSGDFLVPRRMGQTYLDKPPLLYWMTASSYAIFGTSIESARLVPIVASTLTALCTFWLGSLVVGRRQAWVASVLLLCCAGFLVSSRFVYMDTLLTLCTTVTSLSGYAALQGPRLKKRYWTLAATACGLGILTKGPVIVALCVPPLLATRWLTRSRHENQLRLTALAWCVFTGVAVVIAAPWFIAINFANGGLNFASDFVWTHHLARFFNGLSHREPWWFYVPALLVCTLPCSILYPAVVAFATSGQAEMRRQRTLGFGYVLLSALWIFGLFSLSRCKLPPYLLPAVPALCLAVGTTLVSIVSQQPATRFLGYVRQYSPRDLLGMLAILAVIAAGAGCWQLDHFATSVLVWAGIAVVGVAALVIIHVQRVRSAARWGFALAYLLVFAGYGVGKFHAEVATRMSVAEPIASLCETVHAAPSSIICYSVGRVEESIAFRFPQNQVKSFETHQRDDVIVELQKAPATFLLTDKNDLPEIARRLPAQLKLNRVGDSRDVVLLLCRQCRDAEGITEPSALR